MKRSTLLAVLVTAAVLGIAGQLPLLRAERGPATPATARSAAVWTRLAVHPGQALGRAAASVRTLLHRATSLAPSRADFAWSVPRPAPPRSGPGRLDARGALALAVLLVLATAAAAAAWRHARDRRGRVYQMARRGLPAERIARHARVPQDAVRTLLTPGVGTRR